MIVDIFKKLKELNFPQGEYVVVGGAVTAHGIRESKDLDILVTPTLYQQLQKQGYKPCIRKIYYYRRSNLFKSVWLWWA